MNKSTQNPSKVAIATKDDIRFIMELQNACRNELGFIGATAVAEAVAQRRLLVASQARPGWGCNREYLGYAMLSAKGNAHRIIVQAAVVPDLRRLAVGRRLFDVVEKFASHEGAALLGLSCRSDLETSLAFWDAMGFAAVRTVPAGETKRNCNLVIMRREVNDPV